METQATYQNAVLSRLDLEGESLATLRFSPFAFTETDKPIQEVKLYKPRAHWSQVQKFLGIEVFFDITSDKIEITDWDWDEAAFIHADNITSRFVPYDREDLLSIVISLTRALQVEMNKDRGKSILINESLRFLQQLKDRAHVRSEISDEHAKLQKANLQTIEKLLKKLSPPK